MTTITKLASPAFKRVGLRRHRKTLTIELRAIKQYESMSDETHCYEARIFADGVYVCDVSNHGHGGGDVASDWKAYKELDEKVKSYFPEWSLDGGKTNLETDLEIVCGEIVNDFVVWRELAKQMRRKVLFTKPGDKRLYYLTIPKQVTDPAAAVAKWKASNAGKYEHIVNELPVEKAMTIWRTHQ